MGNLNKMHIIKKTDIPLLVKNKSRWVGLRVEPECQGQ
jgi:hypothetical protein